MTETATAKAAAPARSPARASLASTIARLKAATAAYAPVAEGNNRLAAVESRGRELQEKLKLLTAKENERLGAWYLAGCEGPRPEPTQERLAVEIELGQIAADVMAVQKIRPAHDIEANRLAAVVRAAQTERDAALYATVIEIAGAWLAGPYREALIAMFRVEAVMQGLVEELTERAVGQMPAPSLVVVAEIREAFKAIWAATSVDPNRAPGRRLLAALVDDPNATL